MYVRCRLSQQGDRLIAISAIAREMKSLMHCRYVAGHWEFDLIRQLTWSGYHASTRAATYRAPSWSWASVERSPDPGDPGYELPSASDNIWNLATVTNSHIDLVGNDEMGPVKGGYLEITGHVLSARIPETLSEAKWCNPNDLPLLVEGSATGLRFYPDDKDLKLGRSLYCVPLTMTLNRESPLKKDQINGIVIEPIGSSGLYQRIDSLEHRAPQKGTYAEFSSAPTFQRDDPVIKMLGVIGLGEDGWETFTVNTSGMKPIRIV